MPTRRQSDHGCPACYRLLRKSSRSRGRSERVRIHAPRRLVSRLVEDVGVAPQGHGRVLVAQHIGNYVYGDVRPYRERCCGVPQDVKADPGETGPFEVLEEVPMNASLAV